MLLNELRVWKEKVHKLALEKAVISLEKKALIEVQRGLTDKVAEKCDELEQVKKKMLEERENMQQELKNNQEVLQEEVRVKLVMVKENEALRTDLQKMTTEKRAIEEKMDEQKELLAALKDLLNQS